jgi:molybdopterin molybdotransferase
VVCGKVHHKYLFGLPGNPVSTMVTFDLFVQPMIDGLAGAKPSPLRFVQAALKRDFKTKTGLTRFLPAILSGGHEKPEVELVAWQGSGDIAAMSKANCYLVVPEDKELLKAGEMASILLP